MKKSILICGLAASLLVLAGCAKNTQDQTAAAVLALTSANHDYKGEVATKTAVKKAHKKHKHKVVTKAAATAATTTTTTTDTTTTN